MIDFDFKTERIPEKLKALQRKNFHPWYFSADHFLRYGSIVGFRYC